MVARVVGVGFAVQALQSALRVPGQSSGVVPGLAGHAALVVEREAAVDGACGAANADFLEPVVVDRHVAAHASRLRGGGVDRVLRDDAGAAGAHRYAASGVDQAVAQSVVTERLIVCGIRRIDLREAIQRVQRVVRRAGDRPGRRSDRRDVAHSVPAVGLLRHRRTDAILVRETRQPTPGVLPVQAAGAAAHHPAEQSPGRVVLVVHRQVVRVGDRHQRARAVIRVARRAALIGGFCEEVARRKAASWPR